MSEGISLVLDLTCKDQEPDQQIVFESQTVPKRPPSCVGQIVSEDLKLIPIIAVDFSMGNLTFKKDVNLHNKNLQ